MTIFDALNELNERIPSAGTAQQTTAWLSVLDGMVHTLLQGNSGDYPVYTDETSPETVLLICPPFDRIYLYWMEAQVYYLRAEYERCNNANALFQQVWQQYADHCLRSGKVPEGGRQFY